MFILSAIGVFIAAVAVDLLYVLWFTWSARGLAHRSGLVSMMIGACSIFGLVSIVHDLRLIIVEFVGLYVGTVIGVKIHKRGDSKNEGPEHH